MAGETLITVVGNLTGDPELRFTPSGAAVANFTIASTPRHFDKDRNEWVDGDSMFLNCSAWRTMGENVAESLTKGVRVIAQGNLKARSYEDRDGNKRTVFELEVIEVGPALKTATAKVTRATRSGGQGGGQQASGGGWGNSAPAASGQDPWAAGGQQASGSDPWASNGGQAATEEPPF